MTATYGSPGTMPLPFTQGTKDKAMKDAGYQCQCTRGGCCL
jgi:hypothetical protein